MGVKAMQRGKRKETSEIDKESIWVQSCFGNMIGLEWALEVELLLPVLQLQGPVTTDGVGEIKEMGKRNGV